MVWDDPGNCSHEWQEHIDPAANGIIHDGGMSGETLSGSSATRKPKKSSFCSKCNAWRGCLGLEPTPELYVKHMVDIFREVRRVLRDNGTLWLNLGDSYWGGKGQSGQAWSTEHTDRDTLQKPYHQISGMKETRPQDGKHDTLKPKDLVGIPEIVVLGLRADGWYWRSRIPWIKRNCMPESCKDRPTNAVEYVFLMSKSQKYFYDHEAVKLPASSDTHARYARGRSNNHKWADGGPGDQSIARSFEHMRKPGVTPKSQTPGSGVKANDSFQAACKDIVGARARRNSDWFFESFQGMLTDEDGDPLALLVNSKGFSGAHFATFPPELIKPMILAGTSEKGCCPECGSPWERVTEITGGRNWHNDKMKDKGIPGQILGQGGYKRGQSSTPLNDIQNIITTGWRPTCNHDLKPIPCTVLDPFMGAGTTAIVSNRLDRNCIGIDLSETYLRDIAVPRIKKETSQMKMFGVK